MTDPHDPQIDFASPLNEPVLRFLGVRDPQRAHTTPRGQVDMLTLGTHPDLVEHLWTLGAGLEGTCACVVDERSFPLLVHPASGVIFALAGGTSTLAFRPVGSRASRSVFSGSCSPQ